ncbi:MAG: hypothetical protein ABL963_08205 [Longimicrobiales bacterium]
MDTMVEQESGSARERRRRERSVWRTGLLVSVLLHLIFVLGWRGAVIPESPLAAAGPRTGDDRAAPGTLQAMNVRTPSSIPRVPPPVLVPTEIVLDSVPTDVVDETALFDPASVLGDQPGPPGPPGLPGGAGTGDGGNAESGRFRLEPASPRGMIIPPANRDLRGTDVQVWVFVDEAGRVVADSTRLEPPTRDRDFNRRLIREASEWVFRPAQQDGRAVASWFPYRISM